MQVEKTPPGLSLLVPPPTAPRQEKENSDCEVLDASNIPVRPTPYASDASVSMPKRLQTENPGPKAKALMARLPCEIVMVETAQTHATPSSVESLLRALGTSLQHVSRCASVAQGAWLNGDLFRDAYLDIVCMVGAAHRSQDLEAQRKARLLMHTVAKTLFLHGSPQDFGEVCNTPFWESGYRHRFRRSQPVWRAWQSVQHTPEPLLHTWSGRLWE